MISTNTRQVRLRWVGEGLVFRGGPDGGPELTVDSDGNQGLSPTQLVLAALAACMAVDVRLILEKSRVPIETLEVEAVGERAPEPPRRFLSIRLTYRLRGPSERDEGRLQRAIALSRDKYCSVLHTLDSGIDFDLRVERV
jgi:putative redox protein